MQHLAGADDQRLLLSFVGSHSKKKSLRDVNSQPLLLAGGHEQLHALLTEQLYASPLQAYGQEKKKKKKKGKKGKKEKNAFHSFNASTEPELYLFQTLFFFFLYVLRGRSTEHDHLPGRHGLGDQSLQGKFLLL